MVKLTQIEYQALQGIWASEFHDGGERVENWVWAWSANPFPSPRTFSGAMSSLVKKGLAKSDGNSGNDACVCITAAGKVALDDLNAEGQ